MNTKRNLLLSLIVAIFVLSIPAFASAQMGMNPCGKMMNPCGEMMMNPCAKTKHMKMRHKMMKEQHEMKLETMGMLKETMEIIRDLNHKPGKKEKKRLTEMIERLGEIEETCKTRKKKWRKGHRDDKKHYMDDDNGHHDNGHHDNDHHDDDH